MKAKDIKIGERYQAKVSGKLTTVRIVAEKESGGNAMWGGVRSRISKYWIAVNEATKREVHIRSAQRLQPIQQWYIVTIVGAGTNQPIRHRTKATSEKEAYDKVEAIYNQVNQHRPPFSSLTVGVREVK